ncbi:hypothetical protein CVT24_000637 [Panaeolus cyanescens]|uniref:Uncharacterized protein n=1 Tax=Panaeolus cyanescens TaxID=181874 RepID=A0A409WPA0_9AGAR|nr:hypothetical protein CVT24_000637 [Panaeolus cyanescens]
MIDASSNYNASQAPVGEQDGWAGPSPAKRWRPQPYQSGQTLTRHVQIDAAETLFSTTAAENLKVIDDPLQHGQSLDYIGSQTTARLQAASGAVYFNESCVAPAVDIQAIHIQNPHTTTYYPAHQPIAPQQQSKYTSLFQHLTFMSHVEAHGGGKLASKTASGSVPSTAQIQPCLSTVTTPLTSRQSKCAGSSISLSALKIHIPPHSSPFGSATAPEGTVNSAVPRALPHTFSHTQPPVQAHEPPHQPYTMLSTKAVKGRHLLPTSGIPSPPSAIVTPPRNCPSSRSHPSGILGQRTCSLQNGESRNADVNLLRWEHISIRYSDSGIQPLQPTHSSMINSRFQCRHFRLCLLLPKQFEGAHHEHQQ